jgi:hypothetical protein
VFTRRLKHCSGTACIIRGVVSPNGAKFAVSLDNSTVSGLSSKASFTRNDSVLFYASGLDPETTHSLEIRNEDGGELTLPLGSFSSFASGSPEYVLCFVLAVPN